MGNLQSTIDPVHLRIYSNIIQINQPNKRVQMINTCMASMEYVNSATNEAAPNVDPNLAFPSGDPNKYLESVDSESSLRRLDQPLRKCSTGKFQPNQTGDMFDARILVPHKPAPMNQFTDLSFPKVLLNIGPYDCRAKADAVNTSVSEKPFFNATKQDRYNIKDGAPRNLR